jgi:small conductance mechanosensitive channel
MNHDRLMRIFDFITENAVHYSFQIMGALIILFVGWTLSRFTARFTQRTLHKQKVDVTVHKFIVQTVYWIVLILAFLLALSSLGVQIAPLIAGFSVAGVGAGLALQGPLSNYASGITLIFTKPFKVGDIIEVVGLQGVQGEVKDISLPRTELLGLDGSIIIIPNKHIIGEVIKNYSEYRKLEIQVGISYDNDADTALSIIDKVLKNNKLVPSNQPIKAGINSFGSNGINLQVFVWVLPGNYWDVRFAAHKAIRDELKKQNFTIRQPVTA